MKSKAHISSHPLHPILVAFPIAFFIGTLLFDVLYILAENEGFGTTAYYMNIGGILGAVAAAIPGIIDYIYTVPPKSSAKKRATGHAILNVTVLFLFIVAFAMRRNDASHLLLTGLEILAVILLSIAGWMGGTLVYRNQIGVDIRYADAGKWKEEHFLENRGAIAIATIDELKLNQMKLVHVLDKRIVIARTENGYVAFDDRCTHRGASLAGGSMMCGTVQCPWHGSQFDVVTGEAKAGPAGEGIQVYSLREEGGRVLLLL